MKRKIVISVIVLILMVAGIWFFVPKKSVQAPNPMPAISSTQETSENKSIQLENLTSGMLISSPITIKGKARGVWFFEASFPIEIQDSDGNILGQGIAKAESEWTTENFVPFSTEITFEKGNATSGEIVFKKDNPSGNPAHDGEFTIPVRF